VTRLRTFLGQHPRLTATIFAAALLLRVLVPAGFMPSLAGGQLTVSVCTGYGAKQVEIALPGSEHGSIASPCAFADLSLPLLAGADPSQLAAALAFVLVLALLLAVALPARRLAHLRPPLRGPPAVASFA
jgi:hypothetical protein